MEKKIQRVRVLTQKEMQQFLPTSSTDRGSYDRLKSDSELLTKLDFEAGLCNLNNQIEDEPSSIVFFPGATLPGIEKVNNKEPNYAEEEDDEDSEATSPATRRSRKIVRGKGGTKKIERSHCSNTTKRKISRKKS